MLTIFVAAQLLTVIEALHKMKYGIIEHKCRSGHLFCYNKNHGGLVVLFSISWFKIFGPYQVMVNQLLAKKY